MPEYQNEQLLGLWLDNQLDARQRAEFERRCIEDAQFSAQVEAANLFTVQAQNYREQDVPQWDRTAMFNESAPTRWWHWQGLSAASMALSAVAIVLVLSGFQLRVDDGSVTLSFARQPSSQEIERLVNDKLQDYQHNQQVVLNNFTQALQQQQLDASSQLTQYLLASSRQERREDFAELIKFINEQRSDDQLFYARQLNQLQQNIYNNPLQPELNSSQE